MTVCADETFTRLLREIANERSNVLDTGLSCQRSKESRELFWANLFQSTFCTEVHPSDTDQRDDLLFIVGPTFSRFAQLVYVITLGICTRSGAQEMEILKKKSLVVYGSPSYRPMDSKGTQETIVYPYIVFAVDGFEEVFRECILRDSEFLCVELTAYDRSGALLGVLFEGVARYGVLKRAYEADLCSQGHWRFTSVGETPPLNHHIPRSFIRMLARRSGGVAEVSIQQDVSAEESAPFSTSTMDQFHHRSLPISPNLDDETTCNIYSKMENSLLLPRRQPPSNPLYAFYNQTDRQSILSASSLTISRSTTGTKNRCGISRIRRLVVGANEKSSRRPHALYHRAHSDSGILSSFQYFQPYKNCVEIDSGSFEEEFDNQPLTMEVDVDTSMEKQIIFGQAWQWFKERRRITSPPIKTAITYVSLPWYLIISGIFDTKKTPILTSTFIADLARYGEYQ